MVEQHGKTLVPQIRFAGFTDPWEQRKLGEFGSVAMCKRIYKEQTSEQGDVPFFKIGTFGANPDAFISNELFEDFKCIYPYPTPGTLLISAAGSIGRVVEYQGEKAYFQDSNIVWLEHDHRLNDAFLKPLYSRIEWGLEGSTIKRLYNKDLLSAEVTVPGSREQKGIGQFFAKLDNLITLHQRKYDKLCVLKKSMLDKMFPKGGSLYPEIRFAGFTDPWEQRKLGELFEESDERASDREILSVSVANGIYPASESDRETNPGASLANYKIVHFGDVVYNSMRMWQGAVDASRYDGIVSPAYVVARPNSEVYARFFARLLRQPMLLKQYQQVSQGNSKDTQVLKFDDFASIGISMPASENEQCQIGAFFDRLDSLITLHQRKYCGVASWMLGVALVRLGSESDGAFGEMKHVLR
ncbi:restriction endonuclease subunit S [Bifidobacterium pseudocatenulatum]|uniref:restriction endonuclease subunit S n=1 Tax=Bifidobacterium pseudocatenulatum TaxID=28026 RepID=UPI0009BB3555|nr:restriction endonuclease subunit S [Bifidobacterium pseudocatenulatum]